MWLGAVAIHRSPILWSCPVRAGAVFRLLRHSPLLHLPGPALAFLFRPRHHARHVPLHALLVEAIQLQTLGGGGPRRAGAGDFLNRIQGVDEDAVWRTMVKSAMERTEAVSGVEKGACLYGSGGNALKVQEGME